MSVSDSNLSSDEEFLCGRKCFHVEGKYDESIEDAKLSSANDYLLSVIHQSKNLPEVVKIKTKTETIVPTKLGISCRLALEYSEKKTNSDNQISQTNQDIVNKFEELKVSLENIKNNKLFSKISHKFPNSGDDKSWLTYCLGANHTEPSVSLICSMSREQIIDLLGYFAEFDQHSFTHLMGQWIFALLAVLTTPIDADITFTLRCIARHLIKLMKRSDGSDSSLDMSMNAIVYIVCLAFQQKDLLSEI